MESQLVSSFNRFKTLLSSPEPEGESSVPNDRVARRRLGPKPSTGSGLIMGLTSAESVWSVERTTVSEEAAGLKEKSGSHFFSSLSPPLSLSYWGWLPSSIEDWTGAAGAAGATGAGWS